MLRLAIKETSSEVSFLYTKSTPADPAGLQVSRGTPQILSLDEQEDVEEDEVRDHHDDGLPPGEHLALVGHQEDGREHRRTDRSDEREKERADRHDPVGALADEQHDRREGDQAEDGREEQCVLDLGGAGERPFLVHRFDERRLVRHCFSFGDDGCGERSNRVDSR